MSELSARPELKEASEPVQELFEDLPPLAARGLVYLFLGLLAAALLYSFFGRVDEVIRARAAAVPQGLVRRVQAPAGGKVARVAAREGEPVQKDQVLVYLESDAAQAALARAQQELAIRQRQLDELQAAQADAVQTGEARARRAQAEADLVAARRALDASMIVAPMTGQLTRLVVQGAGETVQPGQTVAEVAPAGSPLIFEARVANSDAGRLRAGLPVRLKVDAFPHQEYGTVAGTVTYFSPDALSAPDGSSYYRVLIAPTGTVPPRFGKKQIVTRLGMSATAEIVAGKKRIIQLLLRGAGGD